jgi:EAL domain-containing protein (putative c-di-GMP-specific phosphodiesterase class I)
VPSRVRTGVAQPLLELGLPPGYLELELTEGVVEQLAFLRAQGCREAQGFYFSRPLPADEFSALARDTARHSSWLG